MTCYLKYLSDDKVWLDRSLELALPVLGLYSVCLLYLGPKISQQINMAEPDLRLNIGGLSIKRKSSNNICTQIYRSQVFGRGIKNQHVRSTTLEAINHPQQTGIRGAARMKILYAQAQCMVH